MSDGNKKKQSYRSIYSRSLKGADWIELDRITFHYSKLGKLKKMASLQARCLGMIPIPISINPKSNMDRGIWCKMRK